MENTFHAAYLSELEPESTADYDLLELMNEFYQQFGGYPLGNIGMTHRVLVERCLTQREHTSRTDALIGYCDGEAAMIQAFDIDHEGEQAFADGLFVSCAYRGRKLVRPYRELLYEDLSAQGVRQFHIGRYARVSTHPAAQCVAERDIERYKLPDESVLRDSDGAVIRYTLALENIAKTTGV